VDAFVAHVNTDPLKVNSGSAAHWSAVANPGATAALLCDAIDSSLMQQELLERRNLRIADARARRGRHTTDFADIEDALADELDRAYVVDESVTASPSIVAKFRSSHGERYVATSGGSLGWGTGAAAGVALATGEPVTCLLGDGAFFFGLHGLWPAAHLSLPITYVVVDNGGFGSTQWFESQYLKATGREGKVLAIGSDFRKIRPTAVDVARGFGIEAWDIADGEALLEHLKMPRDKPRLLRVKTLSNRE
jgi:thiamine pyrophosphate-dependent acetolactate synthase large subunit-like protein